MGRTTRAVFGGLLVGAGDTLIKRSDNKIEDERKRRAEALDSLRENRRFAQQDKLAEQQSGLLQSTQPDDKGNVMGVTRGGDTVDLGFKAPPASGRRTGSLSDAQIIADATKRYTTEGIEGDEVDWTAVDAYLAEKGRPDLAAPRSLPADTSIDEDSDEWISAEEDATKWAKDQERFWSFDTTVFKEYGGETQAIRDKAMEYYLSRKGIAAGTSGTQPAQPGTNQPSGGTNQAESGTKPPGSGTEGDPYRATTQDQVEWFKASAPAGTVIEVDGNLYRK